MIARAPRCQMLETLHLVGYPCERHWLLLLHRLFNSRAQDDRAAIGVDVLANTILAKEPQLALSLRRSAQIANFITG